MVIDNPLLAHLNEYFGGYDYKLSVSPEIPRGMYYVANKLKIIYYDCNLLYMGKETQYMIVTHAIIIYELFNYPMQRIDQFEHADAAAVERSCQQFPEMGEDFFIGAIICFLLRHSIQFDTERLNRLKKYIDHDLKIRRTNNYSVPHRHTG